MNQIYDANSRNTANCNIKYWSYCIKLRIGIPEDNACRLFVILVVDVQMVVKTIKWIVDRLRQLILMFFWQHAAFEKLFKRRGVIESVWNMTALAIVIRIVIFSLVALAGLFCILATAGNYWINEKFLGKSVFHRGLWKSCPLGNCASLTNVGGIY